MTAVEPLDNMRAMLERVVPGGRRARRVGRADSRSADASVDGVFAAQAFHWFDKPVALPEFARVLRPQASSRSSGTRATTIAPTRGPEFVHEVELLRVAALRRWEGEPIGRICCATARLFAEVHDRTPSRTTTCSTAQGSSTTCAR